MSLLGSAGLAAAPDGGPPLTVDLALLDEAGGARVGPVRLLGESLAVRCEDPGLRRFVEAFLAAFEPAPEARTVVHVVRIGAWWVAYQDGERKRTLDSLPEAARWLVWHLNVIALAAPSPDVLVHAAVASRAGLAVVLPGRSGAGKTTLVAALALAGWSYLSDEVAALDLAGSVVRPYPRPLALEPGSWAIVPDAVARWPDDVPRLLTDLKLALPAALGQAGPPAPACPCAIVFPEVVAGSPTRLEPLGRAETLERLVSHTFNLAALGPPGFDALASHVRGTRCHRLVIDGVREAPDLLARLLTPA